MKKLLLSILFLLASCGKSPDGYSFAQKETDYKTITVHIVTYSSDEELQKAAKARGVTTEVNAWGTLRGNECTIHVRDPATVYQPQFIGHEISHCVWGRWHP
jgi:hypothetical protein